MERLKEYLGICEKRCAQYFEQYPKSDVKPEELKIGATEYFLRGGKRLRPAVLSLSAGALGGKEVELAVTPAMVSVELFHTFTLVHDDIIDNDDTRRGGKSVHILVRDLFDGYEGASDYGRDVSILAGDTLHAMAVKMLIECADSPLFSAETVLEVLKLLEGNCINELLAGETNDTRMGLIKSEAFDVGSSEETLEVMRQKTGVLFEYCAKAGAMLGMNVADPTVKEAVALGNFARLCGIAFQLKDDILGIISDEKTLGKPIGSDIREGKKTVILQEAYKNANAKERRLIEETVGNRTASQESINAVKEIFLLRGGLERAENLASDYISEAMSELKTIKSSEYTELLELAAGFMSARKL
ncbi:MAG: polyprenyl synthetase family protein [Clostridia bacterium]|nr:polyprenyl synthetase family protein [Clostridia bacterium]